MLDRRNGVTPLPGPHTVELQLKDDLGQESAVASAAISTSSSARTGCLWRFMQHKPLRTGWRIARVEVKVGTDFASCVAPNCSVVFGSQAGQGAGFTVSHRVPPFSGGVVQSSPAMYRDAADATITSLVLEGPSGAQWQDAFVP
ncbi:MAG: hypothetical protein R2708_08150 [Vicinamibacterales bacterium]